MGTLSTTLTQLKGTTTPYGMSVCRVFFSTFFSLESETNIQLALIQLELIHVYKYKLDIAHAYLSFHCSHILSRLS